MKKMTASERKGVLITGAAMLVVIGIGVASVLALKKPKDLFADPPREAGSRS